MNHALAEGDLITVQEAVRLTKMSRTKLYQLLDQRKLAYVQIGRSRRIVRSSLEAMLAAGTVQPIGR